MPDTNTRIYLITDINNHKRLVRASSKAQAIGHCARKTFAAEVATQDDLVEHAGKLKVETAGAEEQAHG